MICYTLILCFQVNCGLVDLTPGYLGDYCDSQQYMQHPLFSSDDKALQLNLYYDKLELCNPLGSRTKKHKIGTCVYNSLLAIYSY